ncbi:LOG family protein [Nodosilinea sp. P-1105]|uniref:LOG family protein n=1 Tax=Nodosilinea sp. P-1105 TaxID=2546229 RepID=UPI00146BC00B|nr:LOG family protein [Nodosilinea sp. P-1105]NMF82183.1 cytochrome [Nodosilinea sp. P-1105]
MSKVVIGVMGPGEQATPQQTATAYALGQGIAQVGWVLLTGGRNAGVMAAASQGAKAGGGLTIGILPSAGPVDLSPAVDIPIMTGLGQGRNLINVLSSRVVVACGLGPGTASEIALAIKTQKPVILMEMDAAAVAFWQTLTPSPMLKIDTASEAVTHIQGLLMAGRA